MDAIYVVALLIFFITFVTFALTIKSLIAGKRSPSSRGLEQEDESEQMETLKNVTGASFAVLEFETTGLSAYNDRIIEVGMFLYEVDSRRLGTGSVLLNHNISIPRIITKITGITRKEIEANGIDPKDAIESVLERISGYETVWAYNAPFDEGFLREEVQRLGITGTVPASLPGS